MASDKELVRHFLAVLAYRAQKSLRSCPVNFAEFTAGSGIRTPHELVRHMNGVLHYALMVLRSNDLDYRGNLATLTWPEEISRFHDTLHHIDEELTGDKTVDEELLKPVLQGPLADAMTHVGQLGLLRRMSGSPVQAEHFLKANIETGRVGMEQSEPISPDE